jgi:predicted nucleic acid-binding protein
LIVVDTNIIAYLMIRGERTLQARAVFKKDSEWVAPLLWRSELRSVLALYLRKKFLSLNEALQFMQEAERLLEGGEYEIPSSLVLNLSASSLCSAYDCEFVGLAQELGISLVTTDNKVLKAFPSIAISLENKGVIKKIKGSNLLLNSTFKSAIVGHYVPTLRIEYPGAVYHVMNR